MIAGASAAAILACIVTGWSFKDQFFYHREKKASIIHLEREYPVPRDFQSPQMKRLEREALYGSPDAGRRLIEIYDNCIVRHEAREPQGLPTEDTCRNEVNFWTETEAVNGDSAGIAREFSALILSKKCRDVYRARFWLQRIPNYKTVEPWASDARRLDELERICI